MTIRTLLGCGLAMMMAVILAGMFLAPDTAANASAQPDTPPVASQPLAGFSYATDGFALEAPEDWRAMSRAELTRLAQKTTSRAPADNWIAGFIAIDPDGGGSAAMQIERSDQPSDVSAKEALDLAATVLKAADAFNWRNWLNGDRTTVTTSPEGYTIAGVPAASMTVLRRHKGRFKAEVVMAVVDFPGNRIIVNIASTNPARAVEAQGILGSLKGLPKS